MESSPELNKEMEVETPEIKMLSESVGSTDDAGTTNQDEVEAQAALVQSSDNLTACLQVVGAFFLMFNSWGICNTFGEFQVFYESNILSSQSASNISWIGSIQSFMLLIVGGLISGPIFDAGHLRAMVCVGSFLVVFGMMMTSLCTEYWQVVLAQGIVVGSGAGFMMLPAVATIPQYFTTKRAFAIGIAAAGSSIGGVIYPIVFHQLEPKVGFPWATRIIAFIMLATLTIPMSVMRAKVFPSSRRPLVDFKVLRHIPYDLFCIGAFFGFMGMYIPFYYLSTYCVDMGIVNSDLGFYLLTIINAASVFGRLVPNFFADKIGGLNIVFPFILGCAITAFAWPSITTLGQAVVFAIFYGFFSGTFVSISPIILVTLSPDLSLVGTHMGMCFGICAMGLLIGNPVAGRLLDYGWIGPAMFCGTANVLAAGFIVAARINKEGWRLMVKT